MTDQRPTKERESLRLNVAATLESARQRAKLTRAELARVLGTSRARVTQTLSGKENMTLETLERYAEALNLRVDIRFRRNGNAK